MNKYFNKLLFAGFALVVTSSAANASLIDFTSIDWQGLNNVTTQYTRTVNGIDVSVSGNGGRLTFNANDPDGDINLDPYLDGWGDGIGIVNDEVSVGEMLTISFSERVYASHLYLLDVFDNPLETEGVRLSIDGGGWIFVSGTVQSDYGFVDIDLSLFPGVTSISSIRFITKNDQGISDFSFAGIDVNPVPEPATLLLFGAGLAGLAGFQSRRKKK